MLPSVTINPTATHSATLIFLHGLGDSGHGWSQILRPLSKVFPFIKFIFPHAPSQAVTLNSGMRMPAWYDILSLDEKDEREDEAGLFRSKQSILELIQAEAALGVPVSRIILGGFSQGGVLSLLTGLTHDHRLAGVIALSAYLPLRNKFDGLASGNDKKTPIFMGHGTADFVVQHKWGKDSSEWLKRCGFSVTFKSYQNLDHSCNNLELHDVEEFIRQALNVQDQKDTL